MRRVLCFFLLASLTFRTHAEEAPAPPAAVAEATLKSKIAEVTVYADRARVTRTASLDLRVAPTRVAFRALPGWIDEGSVRVTLLPADAGEVLDVQVEKTYLTQSSEEEVRKAEAAVLELSDHMTALDDERKVVDMQEKHIDAIRAFSLDKLPKDAAVREIKIASYGEVVDFVADSLRKTAKARRDVEAKRRQLQPEFTVRNKKLADLRARAQLEQRTVVVNVKGQGARQASLSLTYLLPGASWEPVHELRAANGQKSVLLSSHAVVTQTTGEDWENAVLTLSTQRIAYTMRVPELEALLLGANRQVAQKQQGSYQLAADNWSANRKGYNLLQNKERGQKEKDYDDNDQVLQQVQVRAQTVFQRLQQRATTTHFQAKGTSNIYNDGRPVRVALGSAELATQTKVVAAPEVSLNAASAVELANSADRPLLPGPVALYVDGSFLGSTEMDFVAPGESFTMFLGVVDTLKLTREMDRRNSSMERSGSRTRMALSFVVTAENLSDKPLALQLADRVPLSDMEEIRVRNVKVIPEVAPDDKGLVKWEARLGPKETRSFRIEYNVEYPSDLGARAAKAPQQDGLQKNFRDVILDCESKF